MSMRIRVLVAITVAAVACGCDKSSSDAPSKPSGPQGKPSAPQGKPSAPSAAPDKVTLGDLFAAPTKFVGKVVTIEGKVQASSLSFQMNGDAVGRMTKGGSRCTELDCEDDPCCNRCDSPASLVSDAPPWFGVELIGDGYACEGDDCKMTCNPQQNRELEVTGKLEMRVNGNGSRTLTLAVSSIEQSKLTVAAAPTAKDGRLVVEQSHRACKIDADCVMVSVTGGNCGGDCAAVHGAFADNYRQALETHGLTTPGTCDYDCRSPALEQPRCDSGLCVSKTQK